VGYAPAANGTAPGETWLQVATSGNDIVRFAIADQRGDGRPTTPTAVGCFTRTQFLPPACPLPAEQS
jgi:hypothetical protein